MASWLNGKRYHTPEKLDSFRNFKEWTDNHRSLNYPFMPCIIPRQPFIMPYCSDRTESDFSSNRLPYQMYIFVAILDIVSRRMSRRERVSGPAPTKLLLTSNPWGQSCPWLLRLIFLDQRRQSFALRNYIFTDCRYVRKCERQITVESVQKWK